MFQSYFFIVLITRFDIHLFVQPFLLLFNLYLLFEKLLSLIFIETFQDLSVITRSIMSKSRNMQTRSPCIQSIIFVWCKNRFILLFAVIKHLASIRKELIVLVVVISYELLEDFVLNPLNLDLVQVVHLPFMKDMLTALFQYGLTEWRLLHCSNTLVQCFVYLFLEPLLGVHHWLVPGVGLSIIKAPVGGVDPTLEIRGRSLVNILWLHQELVRALFVARMARHCHAGGTTLDLLLAFVVHLRLHPWTHLDWRFVTNLAGIKRDWFFMSTCHQRVGIFFNRWFYLFDFGIAEVEWILF